MGVIDNASLAVGEGEVVAMVGMTRCSKSTLSGFEEIGGVGAGETGAIFSPAAKGTLDLDLNRQARTLTFKLTFSGLTTPVTATHIHFGKRRVAGGIIVFFCANIDGAPPGTQPCPAGGGTVTGTITGANVIGPERQNIPAGDFDALVAALDSDTAYGNIHTMKFPAGEIRGQIRRDDDDDDRR
jgi:hypothetical protein